jgi:predicted glutamine amidotransferase
MCKLAGWTSSKENPLSKVAADAAIMAAHKVIRVTERDGFGYAQAGASGLRSKYVNPSEFKGINSLPNLYNRAGKAAAAFSTAFRTSQEGSYKPDKHMIIHGRTATCGINLENVHPFRRNGWTLAHNGVVSWGGKKSPAHEKVTCDSQHLLISMADHTATLQRKEALKNINCYAAFLALHPQGKLTVAVDDKASLYAGITKKNRWIFGTTAAIVGAIANAWGCKDVDAYPIANWTWMEFDASGLDPDLSEWVHGAASQKQMGFASRSLGSSWDNSSLRKRKDSQNSHGYLPHYPAQTSRSAWLSEDEAEQANLEIQAEAMSVETLASNYGIEGYTSLNEQ